MYMYTPSHPPMLAPNLSSEGWHKQIRLPGLGATAGHVQCRSTEEATYCATTQRARRTCVFTMLIRCRQIRCSCVRALRIGRQAGFGQESAQLILSITPRHAASDMLPPRHAASDMLPQRVEDDHIEDDHIEDHIEDDVHATG